MMDLIPTFMSEYGADKACVDAWKVAGAELMSVLFTSIREHWNTVVRRNKQAVANALFIK